MSTQARGTFEVTMSPAAPGDAAANPRVGRVSLTKKFHGDLEGFSTVEMLTAMTEVKGSAGYVAIENVSGALGGRAGAFVLQHSGTMARGQGALTITVVPDSGTAALLGLAGTMTIEIVEGKHFYAFDYTVDPPA
jgi:hypothetical protein